MIRLWIAVTVSILATGCSGLANRLVLFPSQQRISTLASQDTFVGRSGPVDGKTLEAYYEEYGPHIGEPDVLVLALTGNAGRAELTTHCVAQLVPSWLGSDGLRIGVLALQYPGYGESEGEATLDALAAASLDAFDHLLTLAGDRPVLVYGFSLGAALALHVGRHRPQVSGLILEKPAHLRRVILARYGWWNLWTLALPVALGIPESVRSDRSAAAIGDIPAVFVIATRDRVMPEKYARRVVEAYAGPHRVVDAPVEHNQAVLPLLAPELVPAMTWLRDRVFPR